MKKLTKMYDYELEIYYDLYLVNARELYERIIENYKKIFTDIWVDVQDFNLSSGVPGLKRDIQKRREYRGHEEYIKKLEQELSELEMNMKEKKFKSGKIQKQAELGYETTPLCVSVKKKDLLDTNTPAELLDGFRRIFFIQEIPNREILVKVYDTLTDEKWFSAMVLFNSWKYAKNGNVWGYLDRGFSLGMYCRYGVNLLDYPDEIERALTNYAGEGLGKYGVWFGKAMPFSTYWGNVNFIRDLEIMKELIEYKPCFTIKKKNKVEIYDTKQRKGGHFLDALKQQMIMRMGEQRRLKNRKVITIEDVKGFFTQSELQPEFVKLYQMSVPGYQDNRIDKTLKEPLNLWMEKIFQMNVGG